MNGRLKVLVPLIVLASVVALVNAAVFAYFPVSVGISGVQPVVLESGANAGGPDLGDGNNIVVSLGPSQASASITLHPTYQRTYYLKILRIRNNDGAKSYYIGVKVNTPLSGFTAAKMHLYDSTHTTLIHTFDLSTTGTDYWYGPLSAGDYYIIDFEFQYPEGSPLPTSVTLSFEIIFSPQNTEAPP